MPYEYVVIACYEAGEATAALNKYAAEGYRLIQVAPSGNHSVLVMERGKMSITHIEPDAAEQHFTVKSRFHVGQIVIYKGRPGERLTITALYPHPATGILTAQVYGPLGAGDAIPAEAQSLDYPVGLLEPADAEA